MRVEGAEAEQTGAPSLHAGLGPGPRYQRTTAKHVTRARSVMLMRTYTHDPGWLFA